MSAPSASHSPLAVMMAGGGTGGHLFPGIAVAEEFVARDPENRILFVGTHRPFEKNAVERAGFQHRAVTAEGIKGRGWRKAARALFKIPLGVAESLRLIFDFRPDLVYGVGGYASVPPVLAGWLAGKKVVLQEQNLHPGVANRALAVLAVRVFVSFPESIRWFSARKVRMAGNPVRSTVLESVRKHGRPEAFTVAIVGGSQGAHSINGAMMAAMGLFRRPQALHFIHQTGEADESPVREAYAAARISAEVGAFFHDMGRVYAEADLVVCRAGATTVAELTAAGKAIVFIPFPHAADDHQSRNAASLADRGAAKMIAEKDLSGEALAECIETLARDPQALAEMAGRARAFGRPEAARDIVQECYRLVTNG